MSIDQTVGSGLLSSGRNTFRVASSGTVYYLATDTSTGTVFVAKSTGDFPHGDSDVTTPDIGNAPSNSRYENSAGAIDSSGVIHICYWDANDKSSALRYVQFATSTDTYSGDTQIMNIGDFAPTGPKIKVAIDSNDIPHVVWVDGLKDMGNNWDGVFYNNRIGGSWNGTEVTVVWAADVNHTVDGFLIGGLGTTWANRPIVLVRDETNTNMLFRVGNANDATSWSGASITATNINGTQNRQDALSEDSNGRVYAAYLTTNNITFEWHEDGDSITTWSTPVSFAATPNSYSTLCRGTNFYIYWTEFDGTNDGSLHYRKYNSSGTLLDSGELIPDPAGSAIATVAVKWDNYVNRGSDGALYEQSDPDIPELDILYTDGGATTWELKYIHVYFLDAAGGTYAKTGAAATLSKNITITAEGGTYSQTGTDATLTHNTGFTITAEGGTYAKTGTAAGLEYHRSISAEGGTYAKTGTDSNTEVHRILSAEGGAYSQTGADATLSKTRTLDAESGTFTKTGADANLEYNRILSAEGGTYAKTGSDATLDLDKAIIAESGNYTKSGAVASLEKSTFLTAESGTYTQTGADANLTKGLIISAEGGTYAKTGTDANTEVHRILSAEGGTYSQTGTDANFTITLNAGSGTYNQAGAAAFFLHDRNVIAEGGTYSQTGTSANPEAHRVLSAEGGTYSKTGADATLTHNVDNTLDAQGGTYSQTGTDANTEVHRVLSAEGGTYAKTGTAASLEKGIIITAEGGTYAKTGTAANPEAHRVLSAEGGTYSQTGTDANFTITLNAGSGTYAKTGADATLTHNTTDILDAEAGGYTVTGADANLLVSRIVSADSEAYTISGTLNNLEVHRVISGESGGYTQAGTDADLLRGGSSTLDAEGGVYIYSGVAATFTAPAEVKPKVRRRLAGKAYRLWDIVTDNIKVHEE